MVDTKTSEVSTYVTQKQIDSLLQNSRNFLAFADTVPGMQFITSPNGSESQLRSGAQGSSNINVFIDGVGQKNYVTPGGMTGQDDSRGNPFRSEEHTSELQSLMRISYAVFCLKKKKKRR